MTHRRRKVRTSECHSSPMALDPGVLSGTFLRRGFFLSSRVCALRIICKTRRSAKQDWTLDVSGGVLVEPHQARSIRKSCGGCPWKPRFVTSRLPVDVMFLPKCIRAPSGDWRPKEAIPRYARVPRYPRGLLKLSRPQIPRAAC